MLGLSNETRDKLQAAINHDWGDPNGKYPVEYLRACAQWFAGLSGSDRRIADHAIWLYASGSDTNAASIAADLPPAPRCPL